MMMLKLIGLSNVDSKTVAVTSCGSASYSLAMSVLTTAVGILDSKIPACRAGPLRFISTANHTAMNGAIASRSTVPALAAFQ